MGDPRPVGSPRLLGPRGCRPDLSARAPFARLSLVPPDLTRDPEARLPATPYLLVLAERGRRTLRLRLGDPPLLFEVQARAFFLLPPDGSHLAKEVSCGPRSGGMGQVSRTQAFGSTVPPQDPSSLRSQESCLLPFLLLRPRSPKPPSFRPWGPGLRPRSSSPTPGSPWHRVPSLPAPETEVSAPLGGHSRAAESPSRPAQSVWGREG